MAGKVGPLSTILRRGLDLVLPHMCLGCGAVVSAAGTLCGPCWEKVGFISAPHCAVCGFPFELDTGAEAVCGACHKEPPPFARARAVFRYDEASKGLILRFKHADRLEGAPAFARWMARAGSDLLADCDLITPVPLHRWRLWSRRYNQAAILALALGKLAGVPVLPDLIARRRATPAMTQMTREGREANVKGAFAISGAKSARIKGKTVLLIDDVLTTGATVSECARMLRRAGALRVDVLTLARVVR